MRGKARRGVGEVLINQEGARKWRMIDGKANVCYLVFWKSINVEYAEYTLPYLIPQLINQGKVRKVPW